MESNTSTILAKLCSGTERNVQDVRPVQMKPIHKLMARLVAFGVSRTELAEDTGYPFGEIVKVTDSTWFQGEVSRLINELGEDVVQRRLEGAVLDSVNTLIELRDNPATKDAVRLAACQNIINRVLGTPTQHIVTERKVSKDPLTEMEELNQKLLQLNETTKKHEVDPTAQKASAPSVGTVDSPTY